MCTLFAVNKLLINFGIFRKQTRVNQFQIALCYYLYKCVGKNSHITLELVFISFISCYHMRTNLERTSDHKSNHRFSLLETGHAGYFCIAHSWDLESLVGISAILRSWNDLTMKIPLKINVFLIITN